MQSQGGIRLMRKFLVPGLQVVEICVCDFKNFRRVESLVLSAGQLLKNSSLLESPDILKIYRHFL